MKVVIIDDHPLVIKGLSTILSFEKDMEIIGNAYNVKDGVKLIEDMNPDVVLVDLRLGKECGLDILEKIREEGFKGKFIILTTSSSEEDFRKAESSNVDGYILKDALPEEIAYAVRLVFRGRKYYDPGVMEAIMKEDVDEGLEKLTPREKDVLIALAKGFTNTDIAGRLFITEHTVKKHVSQILFKLGLNDRTQAAIYAVNKGLIKH